MDVQPIMSLIRHLRTPGQGCPWDIEQGLPQIAEALAKEAKELEAAIASGKADEIRDEMGDCLWNTLFLITLAVDQGVFTEEALLDYMHHKMVTRHPHVFGDEEARTVEEALSSYNRGKEKHREGTRRVEPRDPPAKA